MRNRFRIAELLGLIILSAFLPLPSACGQKLATFNGPGRSVNHIAFSPDGNFLASSGRDGPITLWDLQKKKEKYTIKTRSEYVAFSPDGKLLASCGYPDIKVWDVETGREIKKIETGKTRKIMLVFTPDGEKLFTARWASEIRMWDVKTGFTPTNRRHKFFVNSMAVSPDGKTLAAGGWDGKIKLWEVATGKEIRNFKGDHLIYSLAFSPDGKTLVSGNMFNTIRIWENGRLRKTLKIGTKWKQMTRTIRSIAISPDGQYFASGSAKFSSGPDRSSEIKIWELKTGRELLTLEGHGSSSVVAFSPDGKKLATAGSQILEGGSKKRAVIVIWSMEKLLEKVVKIQR